MQKLKLSNVRTEVTLEPDETFVVPENCWAFDAETKKFISEKTITKQKASKIVLVPKIAGG